MKLERCLSIIIYLLNRDRVSAQQLAQRFDVSLRTIQRDIDTLTLAGIPVIAHIGVNGGYELLKEYRMAVQLADQQDYQILLTALSGLRTAFTNPEIEQTLEKLKSLAPDQSSPIRLDLGVVREQPVNDLLLLLEQAIQERRVLQFTYTDANDHRTTRQVEPIAIVYQWYSWYLAAYDLDKSAERFFKLVRMQDLIMKEAKSMRDEHQVEETLQRMQDDRRQYLTIRVQCDKDCQLKIAEFLHAKLITEGEAFDVMEFTVPASETLWKGLLLSFGSQVKVIAPQEVIEELVEKSKGFISRNYDTQLS